MQRRMPHTETAPEFIDRKKRQFAANKKAEIKMKDIGRKASHHFIKEAITLMQQSNLDKKLFIIERLKHVKTVGIPSYKGRSSGGVEYRLGYFMVGKIGKAKNRWVWGQFCPIIPKDDFSKLFKKAKSEGTIL